MTGSCTVGENMNIDIMRNIPEDGIWDSPLNILRPRQNSCHTLDDISKYMFFNENVSISIKCSPKFVPIGPINNIPALVQIMAWHRPADKPLFEPMMVILPTHLCGSRPQWVNSLGLSDAICRHTTWSTLVQVIHYLNQYWLIITGVLWHSPNGNCTGVVRDIYTLYECENHYLKITAAFPRDQWVQPKRPIYLHNSYGRLLSLCLTTAKRCRILIVNLNHVSKHIGPSNDKWKNFSTWINHVICYKNWYRKSP